MIMKTGALALFKVGFVSFASDSRQLNTGASIIPNRLHEVSGDDCYNKIRSHLIKIALSSSNICY